MVIYKVTKGGRKKRQATIVPKKQKKKISGYNIL